MQKLTDDVQHELERGVILDVLILANLEWLPIRSVRSQLAGQGFFLADRELQFHFNYLEQRGYIDRKPLRSGQTPRLWICTTGGFRPTRESNSEFVILSGAKDLALLRERPERDSSLRSE